MTKIFTITANSPRKGQLCKAVPAETENMAIDRFLKTYGRSFKILAIKDN